jgi:hypothetical protein
MLVLIAEITCFMFMVVQIQRKSKCQKPFGKKRALLLSRNTNGRPKTSKILYLCNHHLGLTGFDSEANGCVSMQAHATMALTRVAKQ